MLFAVSRVAENKKLRLPLLLLLFFASFAIPLLLVFQFRADGSSAGGAAGVPDDLFPHAVPITKSNDFIQISGISELQPDEKGDFLLVIWLKLRRLPKPGERFTFATKMESLHVMKRGLSLALQREGNKLVPLVWWQDGGGGGGLQRFSSLPYLPGGWIMLGLSFDQGRYLGLHGAVVAPETRSELLLLGGYEFEASVIPRSAADLVLGARRDMGFRGKIGPAVVYAGDIADEELRDILTQLLEEPTELPDELDDDGLKLWFVDGERDQSPAEREVQLVGISSRRSEKGATQKKRSQRSSEKKGKKPDGKKGKKRRTEAKGKK